MHKVMAFNIKSLSDCDASSSSKTGILFFQTLPLSVVWYIAKEGFHCCTISPRVLLSAESCQVRDMFLENTCMS